MGCAGSLRHSSQYLLSGDIPRMIAGLIQAKEDVRTLAKWLRTRGYDRVMIGATSLEEAVASQALTIEKFDGAFLMIPVVDLDETILNAPGH